jgi:hypothetical protein
VKKHIAEKVAALLKTSHFSTLSVSQQQNEK